MKIASVLPRAVLFLSVLLALLAGLSTRGQFLPEEIAQREQWEEFLTTADIVKSEPIGEGVTRPWRLYLKKGDVEARAAWKNVDGRPSGISDRWQHEIAAYRIDKLIGLNMVPVAVERAFKDKPGSLSLWAESKYSLLRIMERGIAIPASVNRQIDDMKYVVRLFDSLIANDDRTQQNVLYTTDWRTIILDHSRAFQASKKYTNRLIFGLKGIKVNDAGQPFLIQRVPRALFEKIKALTLDGVVQAVGPYLTDQESQSLIARQKLIQDEIAEMVKKNGEAQVLY